MPFDRVMAFFCVRFPAMCDWRYKDNENNSNTILSTIKKRIFMLND